MKRAVLVFAFITVIVIVALRFQSWLVMIKSGFLNDYTNVIESEFNWYLRNFNKSYSTSEYNIRLWNFKASLEEINRLNALEGATVFGFTKFSDMSKEEFVERMLLKPSYVGPCYEKHQVCVDTDGYSNNRTWDSDDDVPSYFDWREKGIVFPVLNQRLCMGCWAFSIVGVMESMAAKQGIDHQRRSIQELIDCSYYNDGCRGGNVYRALDFLCRKSKPVEIVTEEEYPLTLSGEQHCVMPPNPVGRRIKEFTYQCHVDEEKMVRQVATHGPLVAIVDARNWMNYIGGIIRRSCSAGVSNHVIQIVGYSKNNTDDIPYFLIRNSFGEDFGDHGYVRIGLHGNVCGIRDQVTMLDVV
ncbi:cathepsin O-like [Trichoplusia ni]|uniref:Cathepsin O-like n=1 Tax=Trichoplusia ni TaxID=7111 RepID=A0A7E5W781_TRINI|nr:cathepsin O-like [Trichoplusia ni]